MFCGAEHAECAPAGEEAAWQQEVAGEARLGLC